VSKNGIWHDMCSVDPERRRGGFRRHVVLYKWASQLTSIMRGFEVSFLLRILQHVLSLLFRILTSQISMECFVFRFLPTHFFSQSLRVRHTEVLLLSCSVIKVWFMSYCGSYLERTKKVQLCFLFPLKHENMAGMLSQFVPSPFLPVFLLFTHPLTAQE